MATYNPLTGMATTGRPRPPWEMALNARSTGLNRRYGLGQFAARQPGATADSGASGGGGGPMTIPGYTPDYKSLISQALGPLQAQLGAEGISDAASRDAALTRGIVQFGEPLTLDGASKMFGQGFVNESGLGGLLPQANQLAQQNTDAGMSYSARSKQALDKAVQQIRDSLAARGLLRSGAAGVALQDQQRQFETGQYDARQQLADYMAGLQQAFVQNERQRAAQLDAARRQEAVNQAQLNPATGSRIVNPGEPGYPVAPSAPAAPGVPPDANVAGAGSIQDAIARILQGGRDQRLGF